MKGGFATTAICLASLISSGYAQQSVGVPSLPTIAAPPNAELLATSGFNIRVAPEQAAIEIPSTGFAHRLGTKMSVDALADHYSRQLTGLGWKQSFRQVTSTLGLVRFSVGLSADPMIGILVVVPFPALGHSVVSARLVRSRGTWRPTGRSGGAGANASEPQRIAFARVTKALSLPAAVKRAELRGGGGTRDWFYGDIRIEAAMTPRELMSALLNDAAGPDWVEDVRLGDAVQSIARRTSVPDGRKSEVWLLTSLPGVNEIDAVVASICGVPRTGSSPGPKLPDCGD